MKTKAIIFVFLTICTVGTVAYLVASPDHKKSVEAADDRPALAHTDNDRPFMVVFEVSDNALTARYDNRVDAPASDVLSVTIDTTNPGFTDALGDWLRSLGSERLNRLKKGNNVKIRVTDNVPDDLVKKIADVLQEVGIMEYAVTNC